MKILIIATLLLFNADTNYQCDTYYWFLANTNYIGKSITSGTFNAPKGFLQPVVHIQRTNYLGFDKWYSWFDRPTNGVWTLQYNSVDIANKDEWFTPPGINYESNRISVMVPNGNKGFFRARLIR